MNNKSRTHSATGCGMERGKKQKTNASVGLRLPEVVRLVEERISCLKPLLSILALTVPQGGSAKAVRRTPSEESNLC